MPDYLVGIERARKKKMLRTLSKKSGSHKARRRSPLKRMNYYQLLTERARLSMKYEFAI